MISSYQDYIIIEILSQEPDENGEVRIGFNMLPYIYKVFQYMTTYIK
jgi:hypothetical protein